MDDFLKELQSQRDQAEALAEKIESGEACMEEVKAYLPQLNRTIQQIFEAAQDLTASIALSQDFVLQVLNDIVYGIEHEDAVCLADVMRYGLIEIFDDVAAQLLGEE